MTTFFTPVPDFSKPGISHLPYDKKYNLPPLITGNQKFQVNVNGKRKQVYVNTITEISYYNSEDKEGTIDFFDFNEVVSVFSRAKRMCAKDRYQKYKN